MTAEPEGSTLVDSVDPPDAAQPLRPFCEPEGAP